MKILFFDLETTGVDYKVHGIHQISGAIVINGEIKKHFNYKVKPHASAIIDQAALDVAGVTREQIAAYDPMSKVYNDLITTMSLYVDKYNKSDKFFLAGYNNASFDNQFLRQWFLNNGDKYFGSWFWSNSIDVMVLASNHLIQDRHKMLDFKLKTVASFLDIKVDDAKLHDALYDIELTMGIYKTVGNNHLSKQI
jgi:DNA polymerase-3 subunit epsilon